MSLPEWITKLKDKNIEIHKRGNNYYAYRITSVYDPIKKRSKKITKEYLGKITPDGIIPPKYKRDLQSVGVLEGGNISLINHFAQGIRKPLFEIYGTDAESILASAIIKLAYGAPIKRFQFHYERSILSHIYPNAHLSKNTVSELLDAVGSNLHNQRNFFEYLSKSSSYMAVDLTHIFSDSNKMGINELGYNPDHIWNPQINLLLIWAIDNHHPAFFKVLPGSINSVSSLINGIKESGLKNVIVVGDKGFFSAENIEMLENSQIHYIIALQRTLPFLKYPGDSAYKHYFIYRNSLQWWREEDVSGRRVIIYKDKAIAAEEEKVFFQKGKEVGVSEQEYRKTRNRFGTLAVITDLGDSPERIYELYKGRKDIENAFYALKHGIDCDKTWMQDAIKLRGFFFIAFISLYLYTRILDHLSRKGLLSEYSVPDVLSYLSSVHVVETGGMRFWSDIPKSCKELIEKLEISITQKL